MPTLSDLRVILSCQNQMGRLVGEAQLTLHTVRYLAHPLANVDWKERFLIVGTGALA